MQVAKKHFSVRIVKSASELFCEKDYMKLSMRRIAAFSQVGLGNIYNYFSGKDAVFRAVVQPVIIEFDKLLQRQHGNSRQGYITYTLENQFRNSVNNYLRIIRKYRRELTILLFKSRGSSLQYVLVRSD